jgi:hypothetical protein
VSLPLRFSNLNIVCISHLSHALYMPRPSILVYFTTLIVFGEVYNSRRFSVGIALGYGLGDRSSRVRFPTGAGNFSLRRRVQNGSGAHPASYPTGTRVSFPGDKAAGA